MAFVSASHPLLLAVPNVSEGRDTAAIAAIGGAFAKGADAARDGEGVEARGATLLDVHSDVDHHRSVYTLAGEPGALVEALVAGAAEALARVDVMADAGSRRGEHPYVGALDVAPLVYLEEGARGAACAHALVLGDRVGEELEVPVFLYGELGGGRTRARLRAGGPARLTKRIAAGELRPDFGPPRLPASGGATLVAARAPLVAFNLRLAEPATVADARRVAALVREGGERGVPGVRAIGVELGGGVAQVSMNVERPFETPLALVVERVRRLAPVAAGELVGLAPRAALEGFPEDVPLPGLDRRRQVIEHALGSLVERGPGSPIERAGRRAGER